MSTLNSSNNTLIRENDAVGEHIRYSRGFLVAATVRGFVVRSLSPVTLSVARIVTPIYEQLRERLRGMA